MEENSSSNASDPKPEATRAGGPDETRGKIGGSEETQPEEQPDTPRGVPQDSRSSSH